VHMIGASQHELLIQVMTLSAIRQYGPKGWWAELDCALRDAAARGVQVKIIVADWALREPMQAYLKSLAVLPNVTVKFSHIPQAAEGFIPYARVEHAKYAVADDRAVYIGTGNGSGATSITPWMPLSSWTVRVRPRRSRKSSTDNGMEITSQRLSQDSDTMRPRITEQCARLGRSNNFYIKRRRECG
jgi:PLD-like domain